MSLGRIGRSPLGAAYRSPLGALTLLQSRLGITVQWTRTPDTSSIDEYSSSILLSVTPLSERQSNNIEISVTVGGVPVAVGVQSGSLGSSIIVPATTTALDVFIQGSLSHADQQLVLTASIVDEDASDQIEHTLGPLLYRVASRQVVVNQASYSAVANSTATRVWFSTGAFPFASGTGFLEIDDFTPAYEENLLQQPTVGSVRDLDLGEQVSPGQYEIRVRVDDSADPGKPPGSPVDIFRRDTLRLWESGLVRVLSGPYERIDDQVFISGPGSVPRMTITAPTFGSGVKPADIFETLDYGDSVNLFRERTQDGRRGTGNSFRDGYGLELQPEDIAVTAQISATVSIVYENYLG